MCCPPQACVKARRCLTRRSSGTPTACRQASEAAHVIIHLAGLAASRRRPPSSNVRQRREAVQCASRISACRREPNSHDAAKPRGPVCPQERVRQQAVPERGKARSQTTLVQPSRNQAGGAATRSYLGPQCQIEPVHCVGSSGVQSVRGAAAISNAASSLGQLRRRLEIRDSPRLAARSGKHLACASRE